MKRLYVERNPISEGYYWRADSSSVEVFLPYLRVWIASGFLNEVDLVSTGRFELLAGSEEKE